MKEEVKKLENIIKSNKKFSIIFILLMESILIGVPLFINKTFLSINEDLMSYSFLKTYFSYFFPVFSIGFNSFPIKLLLDNKKLKEEVNSLELIEDNSNQKELTENITLNNFQEKVLNKEPVNEEFELLKYLYNNDSDMYICFLKDGFLEDALKSKGYNDETIELFKNYILDDIKEVKEISKVRK